MNTAAENSLLRNECNRLRSIVDSYMACLDLLIAGDISQLHKAVRTRAQRNRYKLRADVRRCIQNEYIRGLDEWRRRLVNTKISKIAEQTEIW